MSISYNESTRAFNLSGSGFSYVFAINQFGYPHHIYYGARLPDGEDITYYDPQFTGSLSCQIDGTKSHYAWLSPEYSQANYGDFRDCAILAENSRGVPVIDLRFAGYEILETKPEIRSGIPTASGGETLVLKLEDPHLGAEVRLYYTVYEDENILTRRAEIINTGKDVIKLRRAMSLSLELPDSDFELLSLYGGHAEEKFIQRSPLLYGQIVLGNSRGASSHQSSPFAALLRKNTLEESGEVYALNLIYSGSHYECIEVDTNGRLRVVSGINPLNFTWLLEPGEAFETPEAALCYSDGGLGKMSRSYHDFYRNYMINPRYVKASRPVVLNSWEGMRFSFDRDRLFDTIDKLAGTGIEIFVLDDGWFGARNNDRAGLGDWFVNEEKLPGGLTAIAERCHQNGLKFGLWIEPEMVNPDSDLYRAHPDWIISSPIHPPVVSRNQCILDFSRRDVLDYMKALMHKVISESGADYIKWDMNRNMTENFSRSLSAERAGELQHRYILGVYELAEYLTSSFPDILFEGCASGGGRFDGAMLRYFPQYWTSDDTDAHERTKIQYGTSLTFPLSTHSCHVSHSPNIRNGRSISVSTRTNIAYWGPFGYEFDVNKVPAAELERIPADIAKYREIERLILEGDLYRMENTFEGNIFSQVVVSKDKSFAFMTYYQALNPHKKVPNTKVIGLDDKKLYHIPELDLTLRGEILRKVGLNLKRFSHDFASINLTFREVK